MNLWQHCAGAQQIRPLNGRLYRLVESQEQVATLGYVDTLAEQALLEDLLEQVKPRYSESDVGELHYLLKSPFRYPPLQWGSRFGRVHEPSLLYGGVSVEVTLAESAYYRFIFWYSMQGPAPKASLRTEHSLFAVGYRCERGVQLQQPPFSEHRALLCHPCDYQTTQALGSAMREAGVEAFEYTSARHPQGGSCVALFTPAALAQNKPSMLAPWLCELSQERVSFKAVGQSQLYHFSLSQFEHQGQLPWPA